MQTSTLSISRRTPLLALLAFAIALGIFAFSARPAAAESTLTKIKTTLFKQVGGKGVDKLDGTARKDLLLLRGGNDRGRGASGHDRIYGGTGRDRLFGGKGNDLLRGGSHKDLLYGQAGRDRLYGGASNDRLYGSAGNDRLYGQAGSDLLDGGTGNDRLSGSKGNDKLYGATGSDHLYGGDGGDRLEANEGKDKLSGGNGVDLLAAGAGNDHIVGGTGGDLINGGHGEDRIYGSTGDDIIDAADDTADNRVDGGLGNDICYIDAVDRATVYNCETVRVTKPGQDIFPSANRSKPLSLSSASGTQCTVGIACDFLLLGANAKGSKLTVKVGDAPMVLGTAGGTISSGGLWNAQGNYLCLGDGKITVSASGETLEIPISCEDPAGSDNPFGVIQITAPGSLTCVVGTVCDYNLVGSGGDGSVAVVGVPGAAVVPGGTTRVNSDGSWSASGKFTCAANGAIAASDVNDMNTIPVFCRLTANGPQAPGTKLLIASPPFVACKPNVDCRYSLSGTGAQGATSVAIAALPGAAAVPGAAQTSRVNPDGSWTASGTIRCTASGQLAANDLVDAADLAYVTVSCSATN